jgi:hypothetical protein
MKFVLVSNIAAAGVAVALSAPALAAGTWDFSVCNGSTTQAGTATGTATGSSVGNSYACAASGSTTRDLTVSAWGAVSSTNNSYGTAFVSRQGTDGFGVGAQSEGGVSASGNNAALDNDPTTLAPNLILLKFNSAVVLDRVSLGWSLNDADITVMAYTGALAPTSFLAGRTASNLTTGGASAGWSLVQNAGDPSPDTATIASGTNVSYTINQAGISSSYWLISAYSSSFGGGAMDSLVDYVKLLGVGTRDVVAQVPEPGTAVLAGLALLALWSQRRRTLAPRR